MDITFNTPATAELLKATDIIPRTFEKNMRLGMDRSVEAVKDMAAVRHRFETRNGELVKSITAETTFSDESTVKGRVYLDESIAPYGKYVHEGTRPHDIFPKDKSYLRFVGRNGEFVFRKKVHHPGTRADMFIREAGMLRREYINEVFAAYAMRGVKEAGL
jgi:hypothetical protein